jgi:hypothetical protein
LIFKPCTQATENSREHPSSASYLVRVYTHKISIIQDFINGLEPAFDVASPMFGDFRVISSGKSAQMKTEHHK